MNKQKSNYWESNTVTLGWSDFKDDRHGDVRDLTEIVTTLPYYIPIKPATLEILELGAGQGRNIQALRQAGYIKARGIELNKENIEQAKKDYGIDIEQAEAIKYLKKMKPVKCILTCSSAYLIDKEVFKLIQKKCEYYMCIEPSEVTYMTDSVLYNRYEYSELLTDMRWTVKMPCKWDNYIGYLFKRGE